MHFEFFHRCYHCHYYYDENLYTDLAVLKATEVENEIIRENFPGQRRGSLPPDIQTQVDNLAQPRLDSFEDRHFSEYLPKILAEKEREIAYFESATAMLYMLSLDPKSFEFSARVVAPLD